ncbi:MAG: hypothetical protein B7Z52_07070, partial [Burkholderiales bacterium 12-64-5]
MTVLVAPAPRVRARDGSRSSPIAVAHVRLMILTLLFAAAFAVIVGRLALLAVFAEPQRAPSVNAMLVPLRGDLVDRNGAPLARTIDAWSIGVRPDRVIGALGTAPPDQAQEAWIEERFDQARDLGPALLGRPLGAADVSACAELPQVDRLWRELEAGFSARLVATAGAGKSVCALQLAKRAHDKGWRVLRLKDSAVGALALAPGDQPTLHIIDDAHLTDPQLLRRAEEAAGATQWLLSAHTIADDKAPLPGAIRIDPEQAVAV